jgi:multisubunit Na+/H+ antiporter MnhB subunit
LVKTDQKSIRSSGTLSGSKLIYIARESRLNLSWNRAGVLMTTVVAVIFGVFAIGLIVLLIYKSTLTMHRDDQLFLDDASSHMHAEQTELLAKVSRLIIPVRVFGTGSGVFFLVLVAMLIYQKLNQIQ